MQFLCRKKRIKNNKSSSLCCRTSLARQQGSSLRCRCAQLPSICRNTLALLLSSSLGDWNSNTFAKKLLGGSFFTHDAVKFCKFKLMCFPSKHNCKKIKTKYKNYFKVFALSYKKKSWQLFTSVYCVQHVNLFLWINKQNTYFALFYHTHNICLFGAGVKGQHHISCTYSRILGYLAPLKVMSSEIDPAEIHSIDRHLETLANVAEKFLQLECFLF